MCPLGCKQLVFNLKEHLKSKLHGVSDIEYQTKFKGIAVRIPSVLTISEKNFKIKIPICGCLHRTGMLEVYNRVKTIIMFTDVYLVENMYNVET